MEGTNRLEISYRDADQNYVFGLWAHPPTRTELGKWKEIRQKQESWEETMRWFRSPIELPQINWS
jgi:hypothetical protein